MRIKSIYTSITLFLLTVSLTGCSSVTKLDNTVGEVSPQIVPASVIAESTSTPQPEIVARAPVKSHSPLRIQLDAPEDDVPLIYSRLDLDGISNCVYAFTDNSGKTSFRVYAETDELEDDNITGTLRGFFSAEIIRNETGNLILEANKDLFPISLDVETPAQFTPCPVPTVNEIKKSVKACEKASEQYETDRLKAEKQGLPPPEPTPWNYLPIIDNNTVPISMPSQVKRSKKIDYLYYYINLYGDTEFRRYATPDGYTSGFYLSDENGTINPGSLKIDHYHDFSKEYFKFGKIAAKPKDNTYRLPVLVTLSGGEELSCYAVYVKE